MHLKVMLIFVLTFLLLDSACNGSSDYAQLAKELSRLAKINEKLQERLSVQEKLLSSIKPECFADEEAQKKWIDQTVILETDINSNSRRSKRLLMPTVTPPADNREIYPAFFAYLSHQETTVSPHHTLIFDAVRTNIHGGYNNFTGAFTVPVSGVYVLTWSIRGGGNLSFELVGNGIVLDAGFLHGDSNIQVGKTYVGSFNTGDVLYLRTHKDHSGNGIILSNTHGYSVFAGFRIKQ